MRARLEFRSRNFYPILETNECARELFTSAKKRWLRWWWRGEIALDLGRRLIHASPTRSHTSSPIVRRALYYIKVKCPLTYILYIII